MSAGRGTSGRPPDEVPRRSSGGLPDPVGSAPRAEHRGCRDGPRESVHAHRETVVRRLLARGLSPTALIALVPDFRPIVERVSGRR